MTKFPAQFVEDKALRDAARDVFNADVTHAKSTFSGKGLATRVGGRIGDGAKDVVEVARVQADDHRGILAILIGALVLWFTRAPIMEIFSGAEPESSEGEQDGDASPESTDEETVEASQDE